MKTNVMAILALLIGGASIGCAESEDDLAVPAGATAFTLTPSGGTFEGTGELEGFRLTVPADAVDGDVELWMAPTEDSPPLDEENGAMVGPEIRFGPGEPALAAAASLTLPFEPERVASFGVEIRLVKVWRLGPDGWVIEEPTATPTEEGVTISVEELGTFAAGIEFDE